MSDFEDKQSLNDMVRASVIDSGALKNLKVVSYEADPRDDDLHELKQQAKSVAEEMQQIIDSGKLDEAASKKLSTALTNLKSVLGKGTISRAVLATALAEAVTALTSATDNGMTPQQKATQLWQRVDADNKDINDDFKKMQQAGIIFNQNLLNRHQALMEYLQAHPHDLVKQKELDAVDDAMLMQAEVQLDEHPDAKQPFSDAKKKSEERHQVVDKDLASVYTKTTINNGVSMADFDADAKSNELTINDVVSQSVGQKTTPAPKQRM